MNQNMMSADEMPRYRINGVVHHSNDIEGCAPPYFHLGECNPDGTVIKVCFGEDIIPPTIVEPEARDCPELQGVDTPPTPDPYQSMSLEVP